MLVSLFAGGGDEGVHVQQPGLDEHVPIRSVSVQDFRIPQPGRQLLGTLLVLLDQFDVEGLLQQLGHPASHQAAAQDHDPVTVLLLHAGQGHQLGQVLVPGHDEDLIAGQDFMPSAGDDGADPACDRNHPKGEFGMLARDFFELLVGHQRVVLDTGGHELNLALGDVDDLVAGAQFDQPDDFLGGQLFGVDDQIDLQVPGSEDGILGAELQRADPGDLARDAETVGDDGGQHVHGVVVGDGDEIIHLPRIGFAPAADAHGIALDQPGIQAAVGVADQPGFRLDDGDGVPFVHQAFGQVVPYPAKPQDQDVFRGLAQPAPLSLIGMQASSPVLAGLHAVSSAFLGEVRGNVKPRARRGAALARRGHRFTLRFRRKWERESIRGHGRPAGAALRRPVLDRPPAGCYTMRPGPARGRLQSVRRGGCALTKA